jgi:hypothetical protein
MSKNELIQELVKARIAEARLKKGYEVKGDGSIIHFEDYLLTIYNRSYLPDLIQLFIASKLWKGCPEWTEYTSK